MASILVRDRYLCCGHAGRRVAGCGARGCLTRRQLSNSQLSDDHGERRHRRSRPAGPPRSAGWPRPDGDEPGRQSPCERSPPAASPRHERAPGAATGNRETACAAVTPGSVCHNITYRRDYPGSWRDRHWVAVTHKPAVRVRQCPCARRCATRPRLVLPGVVERSTHKTWQLSAPTLMFGWWISLGFPVAREVPLHDEAPERGTEHHRRVEAEHVDQPSQIIGPGVEVPLVRGAEVAASVAALIGNDDLREVTDRCQREAQEPSVQPGPAVHTDDSRTSPVTDPLVPPHGDVQPHPTYADPHATTTQAASAGRSACSVRVSSLRQPAPLSRRPMSRSSRSGLESRSPGVTRHMIVVPLPCK